MKKKLFTKIWINEWSVKSANEKVQDIYKQKATSMTVTSFDAAKVL